MSAVRVSGAELSGKVGATIRIVGKVVSSNGQQAQIQSSDNQTVSITTTGNTAFYTDDIVEVVGQVNNNLTIEEFQSISFGAEFGIA